MRKDWTGGRDNYFQQRQGSNRFENGYAKVNCRLNRGLMPQMAIRAVRVIRGIGVIPIADYTSRKYQQRDQRQGNPEDANRLAQ